MVPVAIVESWQRDYLSPMELTEERRLFATGNYDQVIERLYDASVASDDPQAHYLLARAFGAVGQHRKAADHFERAIDGQLGERQDTEAVLAYTATLRSLGRYFRAAQVLRCAISRHRNNELFRALLALTEYKLGMYRESVDRLVRLLVETTTSGEIQRFTSLLLHYSEGLTGWNRRDEGDFDYGRSHSVS